MVTQTPDFNPFDAEPPAPPAPPAGRFGIAALFAGMAALLIFTVAVIYVIGNHAIQYNRSVLAVHGSIDLLAELLSTCREAETGQRGYLLTGKDEYLDPYNRALERLPSQMNQLHELAASGRLTREDADQIRAICNQKMEELQQTLDARRGPGGLQAALAIVQTDQGRNTMETLHAVVGKISSAKEQELVSLEHGAERTTYIRIATFAAVTLLNLLFLAWAYNRIQREVNRRETAMQKLARQQQLTAVTLASIGDAVMVTDGAGRILFMNDVALTLSGWAASEAIGQTCSTVFRIINETSRQPVENPVEKVLATGGAQGLANHTLLIRKDGSEIPIDDSGAPIRGRDGKIHGVVLVFRDFSGRRDYENTLRLAKEEAETANIAKDNFLAVLSHELRTPLTPVLVTLTAWEQSNQFPPAYREDVLTLRRCVELEARLIDDLLDLTRIIRGKLALNFEIVDVHALVEAVASMYRSDLEGKSIRVSIQLAAAAHYASADPGRLQQVFWNVLKNAAKFTPAGGSITIASDNATDDQLQIRFTDSGVGMSPETMTRIFQPFEQGSAEFVRRYGGLGLGLSLSKAFVEAQGGSIAASSGGPGRGSTFTISIPTVKSPPSKTEPSMPVNTSFERTRSLEILLVEDHDDTARVLSRLLERLGHRVRIADSVAAAISAADQPFDLLLSDIGLPDGTGNDLIRELRQTKHINVPAVALTGFGMEDDIAKSRAAGFTDHLTKPVNFQRLQMMIQKIAEDGHGKPAATAK